MGDALEGKSGLIRPRKRSVVRFGTSHRIELLLKCGVSRTVSRAHATTAVSASLGIYRSISLLSAASLVDMIPPSIFFISRHRNSD